MLKSLFFNPVAVVVIAIFVGLLVFSMRVSLLPIFKSEQSIAQLEREKEGRAALLRATQEELNLSQQPFYQEKKLRDELLLQLPGEEVIMLPPISPIPYTPPSPPPTPTPWQAWQEFFFER